MLEALEERRREMNVAAGMVQEILSEPSIRNILGKECDETRNEDSS